MKRPNVTAAGRSCQNAVSNGGFRLELLGISEGMLYAAISRVLTSRMRGIRPARRKSYRICTSSLVLYSNFLGALHLRGAFRHVLWDSRFQQSYLFGTHRNCRLAA